jgi:hypothetical protein
LANINFVVKNDIELKGNLIFEGTTPNSFETTLAITDPTSDRTITFPNSTGTVALTSDLSSYLTTSSASTTYVTKNSDLQLNTKLGSNALNNLSSGNTNTNIGKSSGFALTTGFGNVGLGVSSVQDATTGDSNVGVGYGAVGGNGSSNIGVGYKALSGISGGSQNLGLGYYAGTDLGSGNYNVVIGGNTGSSVENTNNNIIISDGQGNIRIKSDSAGRVTMPGQPAFCARDQNAAVAGQDIIFGTATFDRSSAYNVSNGRFTAQVAGSYFFKYHGLAPNANAGEFRVALYVNGSGYSGLRYIFYKSSAGVWQSLIAEGHIYLNVGDYVTVRLETSPAAMYTDGNYNSFSGHLIG